MPSFPPRKGNSTRKRYGAFTKPAPRQYPHQWNWDAAVIALGLSHFDLPRALQEIRSLLAGQWKDGMVPHILYHTGASDYLPDPDFWQTQGSPDAPALQTSGITQPPLAATVVRMIHERTPAPDFVREVFPGLLRWHRWFHTARDADGSGLACLIHPWESGTDDSPRWLQAIAGITPVDLPPYRRRDTDPRFRVAAAAPGRLRPLHPPGERLSHQPLRSTRRCSKNRLSSSRMSSPIRSSTAPTSTCARWRWRLASRRPRSTAGSTRRGRSFPAASGTKSAGCSSTTICAPGRRSGSAPGRSSPRSTPALPPRSRRAAWSRSTC